MAATVVSFGEWLPDAPTLGNAGLITATNVVPGDTGYLPYRPLDTSLSTLPGVPGNAFYASDGIFGYVYADITGSIYVAAVPTDAFTSRSSSVSATVSYTQYDDKVIAAFNLVGRQPMVHTLGSVSNFATLSSSTVQGSSCVSVVNRFVLIGGIADNTINGAALLRWSGIDQPTSWPTANSATAIAQQSGQQYLNIANGPIMGIHGSDQHAVILQKNAVVRMTYIGPPAVFQFDLIDNSKGQYFPRGSIKVGNLIYFISDQGLCVTDGVQVRRLGFGKIDNYFWSNIYRSNDYQLQMGHEPGTGLIYIGYISSSLSTIPDSIIVYNPSTDRFTSAQQNISAFITPKSHSSISTLTPTRLFGFGSQANAILGRFAATAGTATIATSDLELNTGGRAYVDGVKPNVESSGTAPAITVRVGSRNDLGTTPTYTATTTPTTRTGFADFRVDAKYHRAEVQIVGNFQKATGIEFKAFLTGET